MEGPVNHLYDVFEHSEPMFALVSDDEEMPVRDDFEDTVKLIPIAHGVTATTAVELVGGSTRQLETEIARHGAFRIGNLQASYEVRRTSDEPQAR
jgi:hypothetical protein